MSSLPFAKNAASSTPAVIAMGGAEDKKGAMVLLKHLLSIAPRTRVHVITTATNYPDEARARYQKVFKSLQAESCTVSHISTRAQANDAGLAKEIAAADVIFFSGGDQLKLTRILGGSTTDKAIRQAHSRGAIIAGTSAGAAMQSELMICGGDRKRALYKGEVKATAGFGFFKNAVIDTHFSERQRLSRLFALTAANPAILGIGIDEDTAIIKTGDSAIVEVIGKGTVTFVDARNCTSNIAETKNNQAFEATGFVVHTLKAGDQFDLSAYKKIPVPVKPGLSPKPG